LLDDWKYFVTFAAIISNPMNDKLTGEIILYQPDETVKVEVRIEDETVWLTQAQMVVLFEKDKRTISEHIGNIFREGELEKNSVVRKYRTTAPDGKSYHTNFYNLDVIISVGYRVKSLRGTAFRRWATPVLKDYLLRGYAINQRIERIENFAVETTRQLTEIELRIEFLKQYIEEVFADNNDINEDTRIQLEIISKELADIQVKNKWMDKPRNKIGFLASK
jgi:hypothetical protein